MKFVRGTSFIVKDLGLNFHNNMKISILIILPIVLFSMPQVFAEWNLDNVDLEIIQVSLDSQVPNILKIKYVITNLDEDLMIMRGKNVMDLRTIDYTIQEARVSKTNFIESIEYISPAALEMIYGNSNITRECKEIDFTIRRGENVTSTACFEVPSGISQHLKPESTKEYHLVLSSENENTCWDCKLVRVLIDSESSQIPDWIRDTAKWWSLTQISDQDFVKGLEYLIQQNIIQIPEGTTSEGDSEPKLPSWLRKNAGWWSQGLLSDDEFVKSIQWLINNGFIKI